MTDWKRWFLGAALLGALACSDSEERGGDDSDGGARDDAGSIDGGGLDGGGWTSDGGGWTSDGGGGAGGGEGCDQRTLQITIRDFRASHPDFETYSGNVETKGLVEVMLGPGKKPVFRQSRGDDGGTQQITSAETFDQWYRDLSDAGVNERIMVQRTLTPVDAGFEYKDLAFFPIDDAGFGNQGRDVDGGEHNFHFTTEIHTRFTYQRGQVFTFSGDDDLWIFVNGRLALDLGGLHPPRQGTIDFDALAEQLGITPGSTYDMDIFHAERHTRESNFWITTNIECFENVVI